MMHAQLCTWRLRPDNSAAFLSSVFSRSLQIVLFSSFCLIPKHFVFLRVDFLGLDDHSKRRLRAFTSSAEALHTSIADGNLSDADFSDDELDDTLDAVVSSTLLVSPTQFAAVL